MTKPDIKYIRKRKELVDLLKNKGISNSLVLNAINQIERQLFIPDSALHSHAYENKAFPIGASQTISHPYTVAFQSQLLEIKKGDKVLEIGTGSGYQAAVLVKLGADLYTIERQKALYDVTSPMMKAMGYTNIKFYFGDGFKGKPAFAPYDKIIVTAAAPEIPKALIDQLKIGGMLVIPLNNSKGNQDMLRLTKVSAQQLEKEVFEEFAFVPMLKGEAK
ncbi:MAG: protein-L-isoaspartate(D-aspartate) O-methyltransferase [Chitinophagales bacterium]|jgi:protein-L-isoaspartate(D-aspartate) O-methyltransferase